MMRFLQCKSDAEDSIQHMTSLKKKRDDTLFAVFEVVEALRVGVSVFTADYLSGRW